MRNAFLSSERKAIELFVLQHYLGPVGAVETNFWQPTAPNDKSWPKMKPGLCSVATNYHERPKRSFFFSSISVFAFVRTLLCSLKAYCTFHCTFEITRMPSAWYDLHRNAASLFTRKQLPISTLSSEENFVCRKCGYRKKVKHGREDGR